MGWDLVYFIGKREVIMRQILLYSSIHTIKTKREQLFTNVFLFLKA